MLIKVKVFPGSKEDEFIKKSEDSFDIKVKAEAERGEANREVMRVLSENFPNAKIRLIQGAHWRNKIFEIRN